jgi:hypothetical protein
MYKVFPVEGGFQVFWVESPGTEPLAVPRPVFTPSDEACKYAPYVHRQAAYRRCKKLNDAVRQVDEMIAKDGAIIL